MARFFAKHTGMTLFNYIHAIRLEKAFPDVIGTDEPILQVALKHGFANEKSLNREFKAVYGMSPHQYRKAQKLKGVKI